MDGKLDPSGDGTGDRYVPVGWQIVLIEQAGKDKRLWPYVRELASHTAIDCFAPVARAQIFTMESDYRGEQA